MVEFEDEGRIQLLVDKRDQIRTENKFECMDLSGCGGSHGGHILARPQARNDF